MKYFILAGEASGDLHSAALAEALVKVDADARIVGWGGDEMQDAGVEIYKHYRELAFMGFVEVVKHLPEIFRNFRIAKAQIEAFAPDALILTDYPGFNLRIAKWAKKKGIRVFYYISPQLWAWKEGRVKIVRETVEKMYVILPFEKEFYAGHQIDVEYVGHPLARRIDNILHGDYQSRRVEKRLVLLPGSRRREIRDMLPIMLEAASRLDGFHVYIAGAPSIPPEFYYEIIAQSAVQDVTLTMRYTYNLLRTATAAFCTSGTATLETALMHVPQVVCYKGDRLSYLIARRLIKVPFIAIVNLIAGKAVVPELIQDDFTPDTAEQTMRKILEPGQRKVMLENYAEITKKLDEGDPAMHLAKDLYQRLGT